MIVLRAIFLILVILPTPTNQAARTTSIENSPIDWTKCKEDTYCFCVTENSGTNLNGVDYDVPVATDTTPKEEQGICNIGMNSKYLNYEAALFQFQVIGENVGDTPQLMLSQEEYMLFGCKFDSKTKKVELETGNSELGDFIQTYAITLFEELSSMASDRVHCAIKIEKADKFYTWIKTTSVGGRLLSLRRTSIKLTTAAKTEMYKVNGIASGQFFGSREVYKCNPYSFKDKSSFLKGRQVLPLKNRHKDILSCTNYGESHTLNYAISDNPAEIKEAKELKCYKEGDNYHYTLVKDGDTDATPPVELNPIEAYTFYCSAKFNEICKNPIDETACPKGNPECPVYAEGGKNRDAKLTCTGNKWMIDGEYVVLEADPVCKRDDYGDANAAAFYANDALGPETRCFDKYDCKKKSALIYPDCEGDPDCYAVDYSDGVMKCKNETAQLKVHIPNSNDTMTADRYTCDGSDGKWQDSTGAKIPDSARVTCSVNVTSSSYREKKELDNKTVVICIALTVVISLVIIVGIVVFVLYYCKHKDEIGVKGKKDFKKLKMSAKIKHCKEAFGCILLATPATASNVVKGLTMIELLLDTETENRECWDEAYKFLRRLHGTLARVDMHIWHMLTRFLYLQAKKIIDKHGWTTKKRITKKAQKGLIRVVAIRLLSFSVYDGRMNDPEVLLKDGFKKLGFKAVEQYPHCGVLWSVIAPSRPVTNKNPVSTGTKAFRTKQFAQNLHQIGLKAKMPPLPKDDVIPGFGTIAQQACLALGGLLSTKFHVISAKTILSNKTEFNENGEAPKMYLAGLCDPLSHNPAPVLLECLDMFPNPKPDLVNKIKSVLPAGALCEITRDAIALMTYYGRHLDAQRVHSRFIPDDAEVDLAKLSAEQQEFEAALEKAKEELRAWLAERTDVEELKAKPDYNQNTGNITLDKRVEGQGVTDVAGGTQSNTKSNSKSDTKSDEAAGSKPQTPDAAAASPAAAAPAAPAAAAPAAPQPPVPGAAAAQPAA